MKPIVPNSTPAQVDAVADCACGEPRTYLCKHGRCKGCSKCWECEAAEFMSTTTKAARMPLQTDLCTCGHTRAAHFEVKSQECSVGDCICGFFDKVDPLRAAAPGMLEALGRIADTAYVTEENAVMCRNCRFRTEIGHGHIYAASCSIATVEAAIQKARGGQ